MSTYLDSLQFPEDIKKLSDRELTELCEELRQKIIATVSQNGGHLASNLGSVELTVALLKVFSVPDDKIIWDVGHQSYSYKLLTERAEQFHTLRKKDGISGFPNKMESKYDAYTSGHASTSVSVALGFSASNALQNENNNVIAVIGDGALTGGLAYEGLNNGGRLNRNFIVILNDNEMSISKNVGSIAKYLARLRTTRGYLHAKGSVENAVLKIPVIGKGIHAFISGCKNHLKHLIYGTNLFENLGFEYYGPFDGHNINGLTKLLENAKQIQKPVLLHILTEKGRGYSYAVENPGYFHGVSGFDVETGKSKALGSKSFSSEFGSELCAAASEDPKICAITAAMTDGTGLKDFSSKYKERFFDIGIAEEHAVTFSGALAAGGMKPVFAVYSTFLQRSFDQLIHDAALQNSDLTIAVDRAGLVGDDGETHQGVFDAAFLSSIPNITIYSPSYFDELKWMLHSALYDVKGLSAVRYPRGGELFRPDGFVSGQADYVLWGNSLAQVCIITYGRLFSFAAKAAQTLNQMGISTAVLKINKICPIEQEITNLLTSFAFSFFYEEGIESGGIGEHLASMLLSSGYKGRYFLRGIRNRFVEHGKLSELLSMLSLDDESMVNEIQNIVNHKNGESH